MEMRPVQTLQAISVSNSASFESQRSVIWERPEPTEDQSLQNLKQNLTDLSSISEERVDESIADMPTESTIQGGDKGILSANKAITNVVSQGPAKVKSPESSTGGFKLATELPSFVQLHESSNKTTEGPPECKQC
jgi:hypothetical protein